MKSFDYLHEHNIAINRLDFTEIMTRLIYLARKAEGLHDHLNAVDAPLNSLGGKYPWPGKASLKGVNASPR